jgi:hypothetical protein
MARSRPPSLASRETGMKSEHCLALAAGDGVAVTGDSDDSAWWKDYTQGDASKAVGVAPHNHAVRSSSHCRTTAARSPVRARKPPFHRGERGVFLC